MKNADRTRSGCVRTVGIWADCTDLPDSAKLRANCAARRNSARVKWTMILLDTDVMSDALRGYVPATQWLEGLGNALLGLALSRRNRQNR